MILWKTLEKASSKSHLHLSQRAHLLNDCFNCLYIHLFRVCAHVFLFACLLTIVVRVCHSILMEGRRRLVGGSWGPNSSCQAWWQVLWLPRHLWPKNAFWKDKFDPMENLSEYIECLEAKSGLLVELSYKSWVLLKIHVGGKEPFLSE